MLLITRKNYTLQAERSNLKALALALAPKLFARRHFRTVLSLTGAPAWSFSLR